MKQLTIDVGGTFTDCLVLDDSGQLQRFKASTTPDDPTLGFFAAVRKAAGHYKQTLEQFLTDVEQIVHGTTLGTNILITERGAKVGMITTKGFRDQLEMRRGIRNLHGSMFDMFIEPYAPLVPRDLRLGVTERTLYNGTLETPLDTAELRKAAQKLLDNGCTAVAICFLHSYANSANELKAKRLVQEMAPDLYVTTSHEILPVWREFERFSTAVVSAYIGPAVTRYAGKLQSGLKDQGFRGRLLMMLANGLVQVVDECVDRAVYLLNSGPAAAPSAATYLGGLHNKKNLLSMDMGGTSFDVCIIRDGEIPTTTESWVGEHRVAIKMVDVPTVGAGGGSLAWVDSLGLLRVGPQSAGADPGPAAYGKGEVAAVTDADLVLGYIPADYFLGGEMTLDAKASRRAMKPLADRLHVSEVEAAESIFRTVNANMATKITEVSTKRGYDVRDCVMIAGGGGGPIHAGFIADSLGIRKVVIPPVAALYSAFGMFAMDIGQDYARSFVGRANNIDLAAFNRVFEEMEAEALASFRGHGVDAKDVVLKRTADLRYAGQFHEVEADIANGKLIQRDIDAAVAYFSRKHEEMYTFSMAWKAVEILTLRLKATTPKAPFTLPEVGAGDKDPKSALKRRRTCRFGGRDVDTTIYDGEKILARNVIPGPAIIEETTTTVVIPEAYVCSVDKYKNYVLTRRQG